MKKKNLKKIKKENLVKNKKDNRSTLFNFNIINVSPAEINIPNKYYTAKMEQDNEVDYLCRDDILIIDPTVKDVVESGIYIFEFRGHVLVRQFEIIPFGKYKNTYHAVGKIKSEANEYYPIDEVNVLGAVIGKHVELFPGLYQNNSIYKVYAGA